MDISIELYTYIRFQITEKPLKIPETFKNILPLIFDN